MKDEVAGVVNLAYTPSTEEPKRKVSISSEAIQVDEERKRKLSSNSGRHRKLSTHIAERQRKVSSPARIHPEEDRERYRKLSSASGRLRMSFIGCRYNGNVPFDIEKDGGIQRKISTTSSKYQLENNNFHQNALLSQLYEEYDRHEQPSWWFSLCTKCRQKESGRGWEPGCWPKLCPYPYCPSYRHVARCLSLGLVVLLAWGVVFSVVGMDAAPGGQLFNIALLVICGHFAGYVFRMCSLPGLVGMLLTGVLFQNVGLVSIHGSYLSFCSILRKIALVIILTRAGLDLDPGAMRRLFATTLKIGLVPWVVEAAVVVVFGHVLLDMPLMWCLLLGSLVAAVSPAVIVPGLLRLRGKGYGVAKGIPTIVIAVSGMDDAASVAAFGIIQSLLFSEHSLLYNIALGPISVFGGIGFGVAWGLISKYLPEKEDPFVVPLRVLMLLSGGMIAVFGSDLVELEGAGPLAVVAAAFVSAWLWSIQGWDIEDNPAATAFEIFWMVFEPILFSLTGTQIRIAEIKPDVFFIALGGLLTAFFLRMLTTVLVAMGGSLNMKEKWFIAFACMAKASVQAALGPVVLDTVSKLGKPPGSPEHTHAELILVVSVLSIVLSAPAGAIIIYFSGPRLLTKTAPGLPAHLARSRPSLRDITVIDEGNEADDIERRGSQASQLSLHQKDTLPSVIVTQQL